MVESIFAFITLICFIYACKMRKERDIAITQATLTKESMERMRSHQRTTSTRKSGVHTLSADAGARAIEETIHIMQEARNKGKST